MSTLSSGKSNKKKETPHLDAYKRLMTGENKLRFGLCYHFLDSDLDRDLLDLFEPTWEEDTENRRDINPVYWGSGSREALFGQFTPMRQTILLLIAAMKGEL